LLRRLSLSALAVALAASAAGARAAEVSVAVAANFAGPLARIAQAFEAHSGHRLRTSPGATGKFYSQITSGAAPFHVLLSADDETPRRLVAEGHAVAGTPFTYAVGQLVLWSRQPGLVDAEGRVLAGDAFRRLAIANPRTAPYGAAAMDVLRARGLEQKLAPRLVTAESIAQAHQFAFTGNAELAFVALSQLSIPGRSAGGSRWLVPQALYGELRQDAVLLKPGADQPAARAFLQFLRGPEARALMAQYGYR
jgi:molybdate transport system substrate-binding protein